MVDVPESYLLAVNSIQILIGIVFFYIVYRTHPCWKFFLFVHGIFTLDSYYIDKLPFATAFMMVSFAILILSFFFLKGERGERLNKLIDDKIISKMQFRSKQN